MVLGEEEVGKHYGVCSLSGPSLLLPMRLMLTEHRLFFYKFFLRKGKPRPKLDRRKIGPKAQVMYENMYTSFAK